MKNPTELVVTGRPASPGLAMGPVGRLAVPTFVHRIAGSPPRERVALEAAIAQAIAELDALAAKSKGAGADVLEFQAAMLGDDTLRAPAVASIATGQSADTAWVVALNEHIADYLSSNDNAFRARAADLADLRDRVLRRLCGTGAPPPLPPGSVIAADDLTPSQFLETDWSQGGAIMLAEGSASSHVAMLARSLGVPMVVDLGQQSLEGHVTAIVDGVRGRAVLSPGTAERAVFLRDQSTASNQRTREQAALSRPAATRDGVAVYVLINIAEPQDLKTIDPASCDGIGLFRTELMFRDGEPLPDEEQQYRAYRDCLEWARGKPVTIRTLDIGGDKPIRGLTLSGESNPFLGTRGIRLMLARPDVFSVQLRALARAAVHGDLKVMLPMVTLPWELAAARALFEHALLDLARAGVACRLPPLGIMVEVPAAAIMASRFTQAAFFSIGSNDLTQYVMAASRDTPAMASYNDGASEAMLHLMSATVASARTLGIEVSLCGDLASNSAALLALLNTGLRSFSVSPAALGHVKHALAGLSLGGPDGQN
jgi:phosphoenolpyruvate-protein phosphotransferase (PTS system enzyme I)